MIKFACPGCAAVFSVGDEKAGKTGKCPKCQAQFMIPEAEPPAVGAAPPPLSPPPPPAEDPGVEIKPCPGCQAKLTVSPGDLGLDVECPYCKTVYKAKKLGGTATGPAADDRPRRRPLDEDDEDDRPKRRSRRDDDDDRPSKRRDRYDDDGDDRPGRKRRRRDYEPHRGGMILTFGIISFVFCGIIFGPMAWVMGGNDLKKMDAGRMDPEGRGMTQAGRILGMIVSILHVVAVLFYCVIFGFAIVGGAAGGGR
jgi:hypothetical protein